jgi:hypothetical protein
MKNPRLKDKRDSVILESTSTDLRRPNVVLKALLEYLNWFVFL